MNTNDIYMMAFEDLQQFIQDKKTSEDELREIINTLATDPDACKKLMYFGKKHREYRRRYGDKKVRGDLS